MDNKGCTEQDLHLFAPVFLFRHPLVQILGFALNLYFLVTICITLSGEIGSVMFKEYQIIALGKSGIEMQKMSFDLTMNGCTISDMNRTSMDPPRYSFLTAVEINGFQIECSQSNGSNFVLQGSNDDGRTWQTAGATSFRWSQWGIRFLPDESAFCKEEGSTVISYQPPWPFYAQNVVAPLVGCFGWPCTVFSALLGAMRRAHRLALATVCLLLITATTAAAGYFAVGRPRDAFGPLISCLNCGAALFGLVSADCFVGEICLAAGVLCISEAIITSCVLYNDCSYLSVRPPATGVVLSAAGAAVVILRRRFFARFCVLITEDRSLYDAEWERLQSLPESSDPLPQIRLTARAMAAACPRGPIQHVAGTQTPGGPLVRCTSADSASGLRPPPLSAQLRSLASTVRSGVDWFDQLSASREGAPVSSLDHLYVQAACAAPLLHGLCARWAEEAGAALDDAEEGGPGSVARCAPMQEAWMRRRWVKLPERAAGKACARYRGDVSRVLDVCRGRIVCGGLPAVLACLRAVRSAPSQAEVLRVRNGLDLLYDSALSGGFRVGFPSSARVCLCARAPAFPF